MIDLEGTEKHLEVNGKKLCDLTTPELASVALELESRTHSSNTDFTTREKMIKFIVAETIKMIGRGDGKKVESNGKSGLAIDIQTRAEEMAVASEFMRELASL